MTNIHRKLDASWNVSALVFMQTTYHPSRDGPRRATGTAVLDKCGRYVGRVGR